jgi:hypothetical protein
VVCAHIGSAGGPGANGTTDRLRWRLNWLRVGVGPAEERGRAGRGSPLRPRNHHSMRALVSSVQAEPARPGGDDGRAGPVDGAYDHCAVGIKRHQEPSHLRDFDAPGGSGASGATCTVPPIGQPGWSTSAESKRDVAAAKAFFRKAIRSQKRAPQTITQDCYAASHRAVRELKADGSLRANMKPRSRKYLNNLIEQDHRGVKQRIAVMLGFKSFTNTAITIADIELMHRHPMHPQGPVDTATSGRSRPSQA